MGFHRELQEAQRTHDCQRALNVLVQAAVSSEATQEALSTITDMIKTNHLDSKFCQHGACEGLVVVLQDNMDNETMLWKVFRAMAWLCNSNSEARKRLGAAGACELVLLGIEKHSAASPNVQDYGCFAVSSLANNSYDNKRRLQQANGKRIIQLCCRPSDLKSTALGRI